MQRITYWLNKGNTQATSTAKSLRAPSGLKSIRRLLPLSSASQLDAHSIPVHKRYAKTKKLAQISSIALLSLPAESIVTSNLTSQISTYPTDSSGYDSSAYNSSAYDHVIASDTLTVASVIGDSTYFSTDGFQHGFGYDLSRAYAQELGVNIKIKNFESDVAALRAVANGEADMALTTASTMQTIDENLAALNLSCGYDQKLIENGLHPKISWSFRNGNDKLALEASHFLCDDAQLLNTAKIANFYDQNLLKDDYNRNHFEKAISSKLPDYKSSFQKQADNYDHDWELLVAMGYQESHLNANAVSPTGVRGLMMLTNSTAKAMGVSNRVDPYESIGGGARYLEQMKETFADVPNPDRLWFALASYNMGPNAVKKIQKELEAAGEDPNRWSNVYAYLSDNASQNSRYVQCMHYVTNIRSYLESLKTRTA